MCGLVAVTRTIVSHSYYNCGLSLILYKPAPEHLYRKPPLIRAAGYRQLRRGSVYCRPTRLRLGLGSMFSSQKARRVVKNERVGPMSLTPTEKPSVINQWLSSCQWICAQRYALISVYSSSCCRLQFYGKTMTQADSPRNVASADRELIAQTRTVKR